MRLSSARLVLAGCFALPLSVSLSLRVSVFPRVCGCRKAAAAEWKTMYDACLQYLMLKRNDK